jgi:8-oxo-dGTP diphosphatase
MSHREYARLTADVVAFSDHGGIPHVLLIRRGWDPYAGLWALPGGHVDPGETVEHAARREFTEETSLTVAGVALVGVYSAPGRDPRGRYVTFAYRAELPHMPAPTAADDATAARWVPVPAALTDGVAFDHADIIRAASRDRDRF